MRSAPWPAAPFVIGYLLVPLVVLCVREGGWWTYAPVGIVLVVLPIIDALSGVADVWQVAPGLAANRWCRVITWGWAPLQLGLLVWILETVRGGHLSSLERAGAAASMGVTAGAIGVTFAHELIHRLDPRERTLGQILLAAISYPQFEISHIQGHHRWVATPRDPATARLGESFYRFLPRAIAGGLRTAWRLELGRLHRHASRPWSSHNRMLRFAVIQTILYAAIWIWAGPSGMAVFAVQALVAVTILEAINYVEHYGLQRRQIGPDAHERVAAHHSWDSASRVSNWLLINLPRHSDHHCVATKRYQALELLPLAPRLPAGYGAMFLLALVPPLWFSVMDPRVAAAARLAPPGALPAL